jgi:hypothetical protein
MKGIKLAMLLGWTAVTTLTGCNQAAPTARLVTKAAPPAVSVGAKSAQVADTPTGLKTISPALASRVLAAGGPQAKLWGLSFFKATHDVRKVKRKIYYKINIGKKSEMTKKRYVTEYIDLGWKLDYNYGGDGMPRHLGSNRFSYTVPPGKVFVLNNVENPSSVTINGFSLGLWSAKRVDVRYGVSYVFGEGETVVLAMGEHSAVSGFTADPELFAGVGFGAGAK